jgi:hypothetical protein
VFQAHTTVSQSSEDIQKQIVYFIPFNKIDSWYLFVVQLQLQLYDPVMARDVEAP